MRLPDDMFCNTCTCKSTLLTHFLRNSCFLKKACRLPPTYFELGISWFSINHRNIDNHFSDKSLSSSSTALLITTAKLTSALLKLPGRQTYRPAYHADLNSIELIWATTIGYIARRNESFKMTDVIQLTHDAIAAVTEDEWVSSCRHVEELERKYWHADIAVEEDMEKIVIQVNSNDEDTDTARESSDYSDTESADEVYKVISRKLIACAREM